MRTILIALFIMLCGCGNQNGPEPENAREQTIASLEFALQKGDAKLIDELVNFELIRSDIKAGYIEVLNEDPEFISDMQKNGKSIKDLERAIDGFTSEFDAQSVVEIASKPRDESVPDDFPEIWEGWSIKPVNDTRFIAQHPDRSERGGVIGLVFELRDGAYEVIGVEMKGMSTKELVIHSMKNPPKLGDESYGVGF